MERNNLIKKGLVIGIIVLLLIATTPTLIGQTIQKENQTSNNSNIAYSGKGKPDFKIVDVTVSYTEGGWPVLSVHVKNLGDNVSWNGKCRYDVKSLFKNSNVCALGSKWGYNKSHPSGTIKSSTTGWIDVAYILPNLFFGRIFFEVDPAHLVDESNEMNNKAWAYIFSWWWQVLQWDMSSKIRLGRLRPRLLPIKC